MRESLRHGTAVTMWLAVSVLVTVALAGVLTGCSQERDATTPSEESEALTPEELSALLHTDYSTPEDAVESYLDWISYAYRVTDSEVATSAMSDWEWVRVDAYVEFNRQDGRGLDQNLVHLDFVGLEGSETTKTVTTEESWAYRYFDRDGEYVTDELTARYTNEYTVIRREDDDRWLVDSVRVINQEGVE